MEEWPFSKLQRNPRGVDQHSVRTTMAIVQSAMLQNVGRRRNEGERDVSLHRALHSSRLLQDLSRLLKRVPLPHLSTRSLLVSEFSCHIDRKAVSRKMEALMTRRVLSALSTLEGRPATKMPTNERKASVDERACWGPPQ